MSFFNTWVFLHCVNVSQFLYPPSVEGHLVCFQFLAIMYNAAMNTVEQVSLWQGGVSFQYMLEIGIGRSCGRVSPFLGKLHMISKVSAQVCTPIISGREFLLLYILCSMMCCCDFNVSHSDRCKMESQSYFVLGTSEWQHQCPVSVHDD